MSGVPVSVLVEGVGVTEWVVGEQDSVGEILVTVNELVSDVVHVSDLVTETVVDGLVVCVKDDEDVADSVQLLVRVAVLEPLLLALTVTEALRLDDGKVPDDDFVVVKVQVLV
mmetsp:Transcript_60690/g.108248  ORF Transcript_60690/g.108248 Transcript_60690/m.108248 type:complete len:113 (-) Transcript_60690:154-492(-)